MEFVKKVVKSPKLVLTLEIELNDSALDPQEAADRLTYLIGSSRNNAVSKFILELIRQTKSSTWEMKKLEIN